MNSELLKQLSVVFFAAGLVFLVLLIVCWIRFDGIRLFRKEAGERNTGEKAFHMIRREWYQPVSYDRKEEQEITEELQEPETAYMQRDR